MTDTAPEVKSNTDKMTNSKACTTIYALYAAGMLSQYVHNLYILAFGNIAIIGAIIFAYAKKDEARGTVYESHIRWLIRTFWIGGGIYLPILTLLAALYVSLHFDAHAFIQAAQNGAEATPAEVMKLMAEKLGGQLTISTWAVTIIFGLWWLMRCLSGYLILRRNKAIANPGGWI